MSRKIILIIIAALLTASTAGVSRADDSSLWVTTVNPDALVILDLTGSMSELPNGTSPTFYLYGSSNCSSNSGPYYTTNTGTVCLGATSYYVAGTSCSSSGPYTVTNPASMPTGNLWVTGTSTNCSTSYTGAFSLSAGSNSLNTATNFYIASTSSCGGSGVVYYPSSGTGHTKSCTASSYFATTGYVASDCTNGPFYTSSGTGHTTACTRYTLCTTPFSGTSGAWTASDCTAGPYYMSSGSGHTTSCPTSTTCTITSSLYSASDCTNGPFYTSSGTGHTTLCYNCNNPCTASYDGNSSTSNIPWSAATDCSGPFYHSSGTGHTTNCSKIAIAKRALFNLLDYNNDSSITATDMTALNVRFGLMRYYNCSSSSGAMAYTNSNSCIKLSWGLTLSDNTTTTPYSDIYCNNATSCASTVTSCTTSSPQNECIAGFSNTGGTPLGNAVNQGTSYLTYQKNLDPQASCRSKSIILITDGADTYSCSGDGSSTGTSQRRSPVYYAKQAAALNYKVYVVGFGAAMPQTDQNTLNWTAWYGGTRNPNVTQSGDTSAVTVGTNPCSNGTDPGLYNLSGYAFLASNPDDLVNSLTSAITAIQSANYSFSSQAAIAAARVQNENYIYEASFEPKNSTGINKEPFWTGHLRKDAIGDSGQILTPSCWDAGAILQSTDSSSRNIWTYKGLSNNALTSFNTSNITDADVGEGTSTTTCGNSCNLVVGFYRGDSTYNLENWKLGDPFHTNPIIIKTPNPFFYDPRENGATSYNAYYSAYQRPTAGGKQLVLLGANDGQLHAFRTGSTGDYSAPGDCSTGGNEVWSFIPPNLLQKLQEEAHNDHSDRADLLQYHDYFVDGPIQVGDVWLPATDSSGTSKNSTDWKTLAVFAEGQGGGNYLWSNSSTCYFLYSTSTSGFNANFDSTNYPYYCGYYALDVTDTTSVAKPTYKWHLMPTASQALYLAQPWSKMQMGRVKIGANEKWVGFIGGGYSADTCVSADLSTSYACNTVATYSPGKGFFVVDLRDGSILWSFTYGSTATQTSTGGTSPYMQFSAPASPTAVDLDNDGFIDTVYMGDIGGNMWRFRLCTVNDSTSCNASNWTGSRLFSSTNAERGSALTPASNTHKQIFTESQVTKDAQGNVWVYFGTGEATDPTCKPTDTSDTHNRLYGIKESLNLTTPITSATLTNITGGTPYNCLTTTNNGWYYNLSTNPVTLSDGTTISNPVGEKMISDAAIFGGIVQFPTYVPYQGTGTSCGMSGDSFDHKLNYCTGAETITYIGHGEASSVLVSYRPGYTAADTYVTASGGAGTAALTQDVGQAPTTSNMNNVIYWRDKRLQ